jgi:hypothetical protein
MLGSNRRRARRCKVSPKTHRRPRFRSAGQGTTIQWGPWRSRQLCWPRPVQERPGALVARQRRACRASTFRHSASLRANRLFPPSTKRSVASGHLQHYIALAHSATLSYSRVGQRTA